LHAFDQIDYERLANVVARQVFESGGRPRLVKIKSHLSYFFIVLGSSFPRKNVTPVASKPSRESSLDFGSRSAWPE
jgi:hypothetical protein